MCYLTVLLQCTCVLCVPVSDIIVRMSVGSIVRGEGVRG